MGGRIRKEELLGSLPPVGAAFGGDPTAQAGGWPEEGAGAGSGAGVRMLVVLDDDPTGTQTVHGIDVVTEWSCETLRAVMAERPPAFYILTNSRSCPGDEAAALNREIARNLCAAAGPLGVDFDIVSRSDSTLRGHYPGETDALRETLESCRGQRFDGDVIIPFFLEGGRFTVNGRHYVQEGEWLVPAAETEFARDTVFGYRSSDLAAWVEEKTAGRIKASEVVRIDLSDLRTGGGPAVSAKLRTMGPGKACVVDAVAYSDLEVFVAALLTGECRKKRFLFRTAASFVRVRAGIPPHPLLTSADFARPGHEGRGGLVVVGSHIKKSSDQLTALLALPGTAGIELSVPRVLDPAGCQTELDRVTHRVAEEMESGRDAVVYTSRDLITRGDARADLAVSQTVSGALVQVVRNLAQAPRFVVGKGGITSSDVATKGLGIRRARVLGQLLPGVPVWTMGGETKFPGMNYVVFPGNVGDAGALARAVTILRGGEEAAS